MKYKYFLCAVVLTILLPGIILSLYANTENTSPGSSEPQTSETQEPAPIAITVLTDTGVHAMELEDYITGVVLAEMPVSFHTEALKAQAVVARTFTLKRCASAPKHDSADVCTDYACCQAYCAPQDFLAMGGTEADLRKVQGVVSGTAGQVLTYQNELIEATYFSCSGGRTEDAVAVWGSEIPYLQATDSPGEEYAAHYTDTVSFGISEFCALLGMDLSQTSANLVGAVTYTDGGGVDSIVLNGEVFKGTVLRQNLGLRSTAFVITAVGETVTITTKGFGHRVGMSQYGADAMAAQGSTYEQILYHYYKGTELSVHKP